MAIFLKAMAIIATIAAVLFFLRSRRVSPKRPEFTDQEHGQYHEFKQAALEKVLGPMHNLVGHALIPFQIGGAVDMYYFPNCIGGTGFATMELIEPDGLGPKPNRIGTYELVAFTKHKISNKEEDSNNDQPFNKIERRLCGILTSVGYYSYQAVLDPGETCELPGKDQGDFNCIILDEYKPNGKSFEINGKKHCLLLCMEVFRSEMEYAMENGSKKVIEKLKQAGHYPYSDLDREPVL